MWGVLAIHVYERQKEKNIQRKEKEHISIVLFVIISLFYLCRFESSVVIELINDTNFLGFLDI